MGIISFDDFSGKKRNGLKKTKIKPIVETKKRNIVKSRTKSKPKPKPKPESDTSRTNMRSNSRPIKKNNRKNINESSFQVGDDYKVKTTIDVPVSLVQDYIKKVEEESGKNALLNYTETELAEQMINHIVKQNLTLDLIPTALSIGDKEASEISDEISDTDADELSTDFDDSIDIEDGEDLEFEDDKSETETESDTDKATDDDLEFDSIEDTDESESEEIELESESIEDIEETTEEEEELTNLYQKIGYSNTQGNTYNPYYKNRQWK